MSRRAWWCVAVILMAIVGIGCAAPVDESAASASSAVEARSARKLVEGLELVDLFVDGADNSSPVIVVMHGYGGKPEELFAAWSAFPGKVRFVFPRGPIEAGDGYSWFDYADGMSDEAFGRAVAAAGDHVMRAVARHIGARSVLVAGISQGGFVAYGIAARHVAKAKYVFPIAASSAGPLLPRNQARTSPVLAFHGKADDVVDVRYAREAVAAFKAEGNEAQLREYANVGHAPSARMIADVHAAMASHVELR